MRCCKVEASSCLGGKVLPADRFGFHPQRLSSGRRPKDGPALKGNRRRLSTSAALRRTWSEWPATGLRFDFIDACRADQRAPGLPVMREALSSLVSPAQGNEIHLGE